MEFLVKVVPANCHPGLPRDRWRTPQDRKLSEGRKDRRSSEGLTKGAKIWQKQPLPTTSGASQPVLAPAASRTELPGTWQLAVTGPDSPLPPAHLSHGPLVARARSPARLSAQLGNIKILASLEACIRSSGLFSCCCCQMLMGVWEASEEVFFGARLKLGCRAGSA